MFVPVIAGSDKTTVSVAMGHQEYHPVYMSPGNLTNTASRWDRAICLGNQQMRAEVSVLGIAMSRKAISRKQAMDDW